MQLSHEQADTFGREGVLLLHDVFSPHEVAHVKAELPALLRQEGAGRVLEEGAAIVRSVYGSHRVNTVCDQLARHPRLLRPASQLLGGPVYVHQFKINAKAAFGGEQWEWHQDYIFWRNEDGMPTDRVVNVALYLDDVTEFNGPMVVLPGSQQEGVIATGTSATSATGAAAVPPERESGPNDAHDAATNGGSPAWLSHVSTGLKYAIDVRTMQRLVPRYGLRSMIGRAGSVLFFHPNVVHGSQANMSPFDRAVAIVTFNSTANALPPSAHPRPDFLAARDFRPLEPVADDVWARPLLV